MKITVEIDCTPVEMREMIGLPDVSGLQAEWLEKMREGMLADPAVFAPEKLMENWSKAAAPQFDIMSDMFQAFMKASAGGKG